MLLASKNIIISNIYLLVYILPENFSKKSFRELRAADTFCSVVFGKMGECGNESNDHTSLHIAIIHLFIFKSIPTRFTNSMLQAHSYRI